MTLDRTTQTSAILGTAILGRTVLGVVLSATGNLPNDTEGGTSIANPWRPRAEVTTTWTPRS